MAGKGDRRAFQGVVDILVGVRGADGPKPAFDGAHTFLEQHEAEVSPTGSIVAGGVVAIVVDRTFGGTGLEQDGVERQAGTLWSHWDTVLFREVRQRGHQTLAEGNGAGGMGIAAGDNFIEAPFAGRETERVGVEGAGMNGFAGNNFSHRRFGAAERGERSAATNGFAQNSEVGLEAVVTLGTRSAEAKTSDRFISDHHDAIAITEFANGGHEAGDRFDAAGVAQGGLKDDGRDLALERINAAPEMCWIVPSGDHEFLGDFGDDALARVNVRGIFRIIPGGRRIGETGETFIAPAMIMTLKTKNERATGGGAGEAEGGHDGLGGTVVESHQINRGDH